MDIQDNLSTRWSNMLEDPKDQLKNEKDFVYQRILDSMKLKMRECVIVHHLIHEDEIRSWLAKDHQLNSKIKYVTIGFMFFWPHRALVVTW